jgi:alpha-amylase/alpha-mannosidase (GH57 family)
VLLAHLGRTSASVRWQDKDKKNKFWKLLKQLRETNTLSEAQKNTTRRTLNSELQSTLVRHWLSIPLRSTSLWLSTLLC